MAGGLTFDRSDVGTINEVVFFRTSDGYEISTSCAIAPITWICVSSQAGCVVGCPFCATTGKGFYRNLTGEEIAEQIAFVAHRQTTVLNKIHFGGIGEPLMNLPALQRARQLTVEAAIPSIGPTTLWDVTTSAYAPTRLPELFAQDWWDNIAVSLHSCIPSVRETLIPRAKPLDALRESLLALPDDHQRRLVFNYLLLAGVNDDDEHLRALLAFLEPFTPHHVLLMRVADVGRGYRTDDERFDVFAAALEERGIPLEMATPSRHQKIGGCGTLKVESYAPSKRLKVLT